MRHLFLITSLLGISYAEAQEITPWIVNSTGQSFSAPQAKLVCSVGETAITTIGTSSSKITQGFLQPVDGTVGLSQNKEIAVSIYPNPTNDYIVIKTEQQLALKYRILDVTGRSLCEGTVTDQPVSLKDLASGMYLLVLSDATNQFIHQKSILKTN